MKKREEKRNKMKVKVITLLWLHQFSNNNMPKLYSAVGYICICALYVYIIVLVLVLLLVPPYAPGTRDEAPPPEPGELGVITSPTHSTSSPRFEPEPEPNPAWNPPLPYSGQPAAYDFVLVKKLRPAPDFICGKKKRMIKKLWKWYYMLLCLSIFFLLKREKLINSYKALRVYSLLHNI